jgi:hypothetical protein
MVKLLHFHDLTPKLMNVKGKQEVVESQQPIFPTNSRQKLVDT